MAKKRKDPPPPKQPSPPSSSEEEEEEEEVEEVEEEVEEEEGGASESESKDGEASESGSESEPEPEEEDLSNRETLKNIITHFTKDQLVQLLTEYLPRHPNLHSKITKASESDPSHRRIFVYGLGWDCTTQTLTDAFKKYGPIEDCKAVLDRATNQCKGYGFVLFSTRNAANNALKEPKKVIGTRTASCQLASKGNPSGGGGATSAYMQGSNQGGQPNVAQTPQSVQTSVGLGYPQQPQVNTSFLGQGLNRAVTSGPFEVNNAMHGLYGGNGSVAPSLYGVNSVSPSVIGNYQTQQTALQRMGVNSVSPSVIGNYQSQAALQGLGGYQSQSNPGEPKAGLLPYYRR